MRLQVDKRFPHEWEVVNSQLDTALVNMYANHRRENVGHMPGTVDGVDPTSTLHSLYLSQKVLLDGFASAPDWTKVIA